MTAVLFALAAAALWPTLRRALARLAATTRTATTRAARLALTVAGGYPLHHQPAAIALTAALAVLTLAGIAVVGGHLRR
ncbi:hypothetical protein [Pseudofrankia sp. BMG5.36]|uniref:hypothetical protein n=1 Tax=Pseudofrankia sp. BMG5.36 TaxID=1834512 RepID=UPI0008DADA49|nr:hypothetical protein [Pseudofrankia sp. BMG5.36]OHV44902.1 hypothetical protein BCD48_23860 [Pseudofrankia sp. BMG5.36]